MTGILNQFRSGRNLVLVATDVAARGLDIKDIRVVVNYEFPTGIKDYVHRIGRTGRAGATGVGYTFFCDQDAKHASDLVKVLEGANQMFLLKSVIWLLVVVECLEEGRGGRASDYNGRGDGDRNRWASFPSERGGRGFDRNPQQSDSRFVRKPHDVDVLIVSGRNHFETLSRPAEKWIRSRSCSRSRSLDKGPLWGDKRIRIRARSRSPGPSIDRPAAAACRDGPMRRTFHPQRTEFSIFPNQRNIRDWLLRLTRTINIEGNPQLKLLGESDQIR